jgi:phosphoribosylanthranilate isomerase
MAHPLRVKICGVTSADDARFAARVGADAVGLNFHPRSPRFLDVETAGVILRTVPPFVEAVGVFVDLPLRQAFEQIAPLGRIHTLQWYGDHRELVDCFPYHFIPAFPVRDRADLHVITRYVDTAKALRREPSAVLVDARVEGRHGGTGEKVPWELLADFDAGVPLILAGGLTPDNVAEAVRLVRPYGVDVASGVERSPGRKDPDKVRRFLDAAREAAAKL